MKVTLRAIGYIFDITKYDDLPIAQTKTLTGGFDTAQFIIRFVRFWNRNNPSKNRLNNGFNNA